jgi:hypothetical protein
MHARPQPKKSSVPELCPLSRFCDFTRQLGPVTVTFVPVFVTAGGATILEGKGRKEIVWVFLFSGGKENFGKEKDGLRPRGVEAGQGSTFSKPALKKEEKVQCQI